MNSRKAGTRRVKQSNRKSTNYLQRDIQWLVNKHNGVPIDSQIKSIEVKYPHSNVVMSKFRKIVSFKKSHSLLLFVEDYKKEIPDNLITISGEPKPNRIDNMIVESLKKRKMYQKQVLCNILISTNMGQIMDMKPATCCEISPQIYFIAGLMTPHYSETNSKEEHLLEENSIHFSEEDVQAVMKQTGCVHDVAEGYLKDNNGDVVEAIMHFLEEK